MSFLRPYSSRRGKATCKKTGWEGEEGSECWPFFLPFPSQSQTVTAKVFTSLCGSLCFELHGRYSPRFRSFPSPTSLEEPPINHNDSPQFPLNTLVSSPSPPLSLFFSLCARDLHRSPSFIEHNGRPPFDVRWRESRRNLPRCMEFCHCARKRIDTRTYVN